MGTLLSTHGRRRRDALTPRELELGLRSIAVPRRDASGTVVAAANVGTRARSADLVRDVLPELRACAAAIEADLGWTLFP